jgi:N-methylhydantoinase A
MIGQRATVRIGADVGGTFTDVLAIDSEGQVWSHKVPSTPPHFEQAVLQAVGHLLQTAGISSSAVTEVAHGTTVATNAVLERLGARTALVTTKGFRDVLELRRLRVPQLYNLFFEKPPSLIERKLRLEVLERVAADGSVLVPLTDEALWRVKTQLDALDVEAVAVCLLHSYVYPEHERRIGEFLREHLPGVLVSLSCDVLRERREYERTATTAVNCYVLPIVKQYLSALRRGLEEIDLRAPLHVMQSSGGLTPEGDASERPVYILESGPAAGVLAARYLGHRLGMGNIISFDMGGTTAKASMIEAGQIAYSPEYEVGSSLSRSNRLVGGAGELIRVPTIDIAETGAGGGSIAWLDRAGSLHVGPRSAGAVPGPACYSRGGTEPTLTDANVVLGYIRPGKLANGDVSVDYDAAQRAIFDKVATPLGLELLGAAEGIHRIANAVTMRALREVSTQRGRDPRDYVLVAFGGMGPIHAAGLGLELQVRRVIIHRFPACSVRLGCCSAISSTMMCAVAV